MSMYADNQVYETCPILFLYGNYLNSFYIGKPSLTVNTRKSANYSRRQ